MIKNVIFLFVVLAAVFVVYLPSYMQMQDLWGRNQAFEKRIKDLEASNVKMNEERDRLMNDPEYFEKIARERMGLIKDGEVIYKVVPQGSKKAASVEEVKKAAEPVKKASTGKTKALKGAKTALKTKAKEKVKPKSKTKSAATNSTDTKSVKD
ncbi:MAG: septum formation initiator family protein [Candidatus Omnitrophota bacterium]